MIPSTFKSNGFFFKDYTLLGEYESGMIIDWRNHPKVRNNMRDSRPISFLDHFDFLEKLAVDKTKRYFHVTNVYPVGAIYLTGIKEDEAEIGLFIAPEVMGKGLGTAMLQAFIDAIDINTITLEVQKENIIAIKVYEKVGFKLDSEKDDYLKYKLLKN